MKQVDSLHGSLMTVGTPQENRTLTGGLGNHGSIHWAKGVYLAAPVRLELTPPESESDILPIRRKGYDCHKGDHEASGFLTRIPYDGWWSPWDSNPSFPGRKPGVLSFRRGDHIKIRLSHIWDKRILSHYLPVRSNSAAGPFCCSSHICTQNHLPNRWYGSPVRI